MGRLFQVVLVCLVAIELIAVVVLGGVLVLLGTVQTIVFGVGAVLVALVASVLAWRYARRG
jgi:hypothetical protein